MSIEMRSVTSNGVSFQNSDPEAHKFFAEHITKAYSALTDPKARENWEKFGHPDGNQVTYNEAQLVFCIPSLGLVFCFLFC